MPEKPLKSVISIKICDLKALCAVPPHDLTVHQVSMRSDENCRMNYLETKCGRTDGWTDTEVNIIIPHQYRVAGCKK